MEKTKTHIETREELAYVMKFYGIKRVPVIETFPCYKNLGVIQINGDKLSYKGGSWKYNDGWEHLAYTNAIRKFNEDIDKIEKWREIAAKVFETGLLDVTSDYSRQGASETIVKAWCCYPSDLTDSGVEAIGGLVYNPNGRYGMPALDLGGGKLVLRGNINQLRKFLSYANNHYRYCNGCSYKYENEELKEWMDFFRSYDLYAAYDSFSEYYHNAIVD